MSHLLLEPGQAEREGLAQYRGRGGYRGLQRTLTQGGAWAIGELAAAGLRGRGGSGRGMPTGAKWGRVAAALNRTRYVVANGAETSPVSRKDRELLTLHPHRVLEGLLCAAAATGAAAAYVYIRGDALAAVAAMQAALEEAEAAGLCGPGGACLVPVLLHVGVPSYIAGEATALIDALEGMQGLPQPKPPYPEASGLFGCPTVVNNVETLAAAAAVLCHGAAAFRAAGGTPECPGAALFTVSGDVARPGVYELPYGTPLSGLLALAGAPPAAELLAVLPGGLSSGPLRPDELDVPLTYESLQALGSTLGPAAVLVLRRGELDLPTIVEESVAQLAGWSCGQCKGCKFGSADLAAALSRHDLALARELAVLLHHGKGNCAHPEGIAMFTLRALDRFPEAWPAYQAQKGTPQV